MKSSKILFLLTTVIALSFTLPRGEFLPADNNEASDAETEEPTSSLRGTSRFLAHVSGRGGMTSCNINPKVCHVAGSQGPHCCNNKCVNLLTDAYNCGKCGKKCSYKKICCEGKCLNPMTNEKHCGKCGNKCNKGSSCVYGMCSYA